MSLRAADVMTPEVRTVAPDTTLMELNRILMWERLSGTPVVEDERLVGIVSLSDVVRVLFDEQLRSRDAAPSAFYANPFLFPMAAWQRMLGDAPKSDRLAKIRVDDVMTREPLTVRADDPIESVAKLLWDNGVHRVPVTDGERLVGVVTALDLARMVAEGGIVPPMRDDPPQRSTES